MNNENWNPGHSLNKGYPYNGIESAGFMKHRPTLEMNEDKKITITWPPEVFGTVKADQNNRTALEDFLLHRLFDFQETLSVAEGQIFDLLEEQPFIPEDYGFQLVHKNTDIKEPPVRIYQSVFDDRYSLFRKPTGVSEEFDPSKWTLLFKNEESVFREIEIILPCDRIAYAVFYSLGIKIEAPEGKETLTKPAKEVMPVRGTKGYEVKFKREIGDYDQGTDQLVERIVVVEAASESNALTMAKFHLETNPDESFEGISADELQIVK